MTTALVDGMTDLERSMLRGFVDRYRPDEIAHDLDVTPSTVRGFLHRACAFDLDRARRILSGLDVSDEALTVLPDPPPAPPEPLPGEGLGDMLAAGLTYRRVDYWTRNGWLHTIGDPTPGFGTPRRWQDGEAALGALVVRLTDAGLDLQIAFRIARDGQHQLAPGIRLIIEEAPHGQS